MGRDIRGIVKLFGINDFNRRRLLAAEEFGVGHALRLEGTRHICL